METRSSKRKKFLNQQNFDGGEDRISDLPEVIIHQILFLLPIKSIAQTSILSKRWKSIWYTFPDLDFTTINSSAAVTKSSNPQKRKKVNEIKAMDFVTQVLNLRNKYSDIRVLRLRASLSFSRLNGLIRCAVRHNIQEIDIAVTTNDYFNFPRSVINSKTLRVFKLRSDPGFRLAPYTLMKAGFQSLHTLSLCVIILYHQPSLLDLFSASSFPLLRNLDLNGCFGLKRLSVTCHRLENLNIGNCLQLDDLEISCPKLEKLRVSQCFNASSGKSIVKINAPRLKSIVWADNTITDKSCVENLSYLNEASVNFVKRSFLTNREEVRGNKLCSISNFLCGLSNAKCLTLESYCVEILSKNSQFAGVLQQFRNLKSLELHTNFNKQNIPKLATLLKSSPAIHTLIFKIPNNEKYHRKHWNNDLWDLSSSPSQEEYWESQSEELKYVLGHLKVVKILGFMECEDYVSLVMFLLKYGTGLEEIILCSSNYNVRGYIRRERKIRSQIRELLLASSNAKLVFQ